MPVQHPGGVARMQILTNHSLPTLLNGRFGFVGHDHLLVVFVTFFFFTFMANVSGVCRVVSGHSSRMSLSFKLPPLILRKLLYFFSGLLFLTSPRDPPHPFNTHFFGSSDFNNSFHPPNLPSPPRVVNSHSPEPSKLHSVCLPGN